MNYVNPLLIIYQKKITNRYKSTISKPFKSYMLKEIFIFAYYFLFITFYCVPVGEHYGIMHINTYHFYPIH